VTDDNPTRLPLREAEAAHRSVPDLTGLDEKRPAVCPNCDAPTALGSRFCPSCQTFIAKPWVGRLAPAKRRLVAAWLDSTFKDGGIFGAAFWMTILPRGGAATAIGIMSALYAMSALYLWTKGTTPAKRMLRMTVITEDGEPAGFFRMAFRETIGKWSSTVVFGLGLLAVTTHPEKRGWHDRMVDTWVVLDDEP
jgi:uncharacterized RDD family membrane protein YckC